MSPASTATGAGPHWYPEPDDATGVAAAVAAFRDPVPPRAGRRLGLARPGQPDRRARRLQRRPVPAVRACRSKTFVALAGRATTWSRSPRSRRARAGRGRLGDGRARHRRRLGRRTWSASRGRCAGGWACRAAGVGVRRRRRRARAARRRDCRRPPLWRARSPSRWTTWPGSGWAGTTPGGQPWRRPASRRERDRRRPDRRAWTRRPRCAALAGHAMLLDCRDFSLSQVPFSTSARRARGAGDRHPGAPRAGRRSVRLAPGGVRAGGAPARRRPAR